MLQKPAASPAKTAASAGKRPAKPDAHGAVVYRSGKVYSNFEHRTFRVLKDWKHNRCDSKLQWSSHKPSDEEWGQGPLKDRSACRCTSREEERQVKGKLVERQD